MAELLPDEIAELQQLLINWRLVSQQLAIMQKNLVNYSSSNIIKTIPVGSGNLYQIAADQYGDATKWRVIADANNLGADPEISSFINLVIPVISSKN